MPTHATLRPLHQPTLITSWTVLYYELTEEKEKESIVYRWLCIMSWRHFKWIAESYSVPLKWRWKILLAGRTLSGITFFSFPGKRQELIGSNRWFSQTDMDTKRIRRPEDWWQGGLGRSMWVGLKKWAHVWRHLGSMYMSIILADNPIFILSCEQNFSFI